MNWKQCHSLVENELESNSPHRHAEQAQDGLRPALDTHRKKQAESALMCVEEREVLAQQCWLDGFFFSTKWDMRWNLKTRTMTIEVVYAIYLFFKKNNNMHGHYNEPIILQVGQDLDEDYYRGGIFFIQPLFFSIFVQRISLSFLMYNVCEREEGGKKKNIQISLLQDYLSLQLSTKSNTYVFDY